MENKNNIQPHQHKSSRILIGTILLIGGFALLANKMGAPLPDWLFTWPMILILVGLSIGLKDRFRNPGSWIMLALGLFFLANENITGFNFKIYMGPLILIVVGLAFILRPRGSDGNGCSKRLAHNPNAGEGEPIYTNDPSSYEAEVINVNAVFSGVKKNILSKNFVGGTITTFMGGAEINLLQADIHQPTVLELNNVFGGTKIIIPSNWDVKNMVTAVFGGVEDKRNFSALNPEPGKTILIKGACVFGGIEVSSY